MSTYTEGFDTVRAHIDAGTIRPRVKKTADALHLAAEWLEAYECDAVEDHDMATDLATVAMWLRKQAKKKEDTSR